MIYIIILLSIAVAILLSIIIKWKKDLKNSKEELRNYTEKYKDIIDIDRVMLDKNEELKKIDQNVDNQKESFEKQKNELNQDYINKRNIYQNLINEISIVEEDLENISYGLYKPHFNYDSSDQYKIKLEEIWILEKDIIKSERATYCPKEWTVSGSKVEGRKMVKHHSKLMLRAFNGECESAVSRVSWNNIGNIEARITKAYDAINNLGSIEDITITKNYFDLKMQELRLEYELQEKIHQEKEEQKKIREQMHEEQKVQQEIEKAKLDAEQEEIRFQKALEKAKAEINKVTGKELDELKEKIQSFETNLKNAQEKKQRAISRAQQTKSGHVYIISNIGSFGENIYKFGMTRRLDPQERIDELGNASVPFDFDVHGLIYTDNAPELENKLHKYLNEKRVNLIHMRREFFNITIDEIEQIVKELNLEIQLTKLAEAKEYRMSLSLREANNKQLLQQIENNNGKESSKFPSSLN